MATEKMGQSPETIQSPQEAGKNVLLLTPEQEKQVQDHVKNIETGLKEAVKEIEKQAA